MKKLLVTVLAWSLLVSLSLAGCGSMVKGSGEIKTEDFTFTNFSGVEIQGPFEVSITPAESYSVSITADDNLFEKMEIEKEDDILKINVQRSRFLGILRSQYVDTAMKVEIKMPYLRSLYLSGAARGTLSGFDSRASVNFILAGASSLELKDIYAGNTGFEVSEASKVTGRLTAGDVNFDVSGASTVELTGTAGNMACKAGGFSRLALDDFAVDNAAVKLSGASISTINLDSKLDVNLSGASKLSYIGEPVMGDTKISGDSTMGKKNA